MNAFQSVSLILSVFVVSGSAFAEVPALAKVKITPAGEKSMPPVKSPAEEGQPAEPKSEVKAEPKQEPVKAVQAPVQ
ncbi:MAG: hypothetical protein V4692_07945, partial [Bdellovibrionota bacterium]